MIKFLFENLETDEVFAVVTEEGESRACDLALEFSNHAPLRLLGETEDCE